jgi:hypothetical protein
MTHVLRLPWLPPDFATRVLHALNGPSLDVEGYCRRFYARGELGDDLLAQLANEPAYGSDPHRQAFMRYADKPGYAHNMDEWIIEHAKRHAQH